LVTSQAAVLLHECWQGLSDNNIADDSIPNRKSNSASHTVPNIASNPTADPTADPAANASSHTGINATNNTRPRW
jgi:hypothetical protein